MRRINITAVEPLNRSIVELVPVSSAELHSAVSRIYNPQAVRGISALENSNAQPNATPLRACSRFIGVRRYGRLQICATRAFRIADSTIQLIHGLTSFQYANWTFPGLFRKIAAVANPTKTNAPQGAPVKPVPFEEALKKLETIVDAMESGDLPLETLLAKYEEGVKLAKVCQEKLAEAELKIQQLEKAAGGELKLKPLTAELSED